MFPRVLAAEVARARCLSTSGAHGPGDTQWQEPALHRQARRAAAARAVQAASVNVGGKWPVFINDECRTGA